MNDDEFWKIIAKLDWRKEGDDDAVLRPAVKALSRMPAEEIIAFDDLLAEKLYTLDTREVCRGIYRGAAGADAGDEYVSADGFLYARCVIVANGKKTFEAALARPGEAPQGLQFEALLYLASAAYESRTGNDYEHLTAVSCESFSNHQGWRLTDAARPRWAPGERV